MAQTKAALSAADGVVTVEVARRCGTTYESGPGAVASSPRESTASGASPPGRGRKAWLPEGTVAEIVRVTREENPDDTSTHWTTRSLAERLGVGKDTVARIWRDHGSSRGGWTC